MLYLAELGIHLAVVVDVVRKQVRTDRTVLDGQCAVFEGLVVVSYVLVQRVALHAADGHNVRIRIVLLDVVHLEQVIQRVRRNMEIIVTEIPAPFCDHHSATAVTGLLTERKHGIVVIVAEVFPYMRIRLIVKLLIARHDNIFGLVLIPFRLDALQFAVSIEETLRHGEIHRIQLILVARAFTRSLCAVKSMLDVQRDGFEIFNRAVERTLCARVRTIACRIACKFICTVHGVFCRVVCAVSRKFYAGNIVPTFVAVHSVLECRSVYLAVYHLEFVEQVLIVGIFGLAQKQKVELRIIVRLALGVIRHRHLYLVALAVRGNVQPLWVIHIDIQPVIALHIALVRIAILHEIDDLRLTVLVIRIVLHIEGLSIYGGRGEVVHNICLVITQFAACRISDIRRRRNDDAEHHNYRDKTDEDSLPYRAQNSITS